MHCYYLCRSTTLSTRVEHLSRALMCLNSCEMNTASAFTDFLLHLEEKKDVARVQLMVRPSLSRGFFKKHFTIFSDIIFKHTF